MVQGKQGILKCKGTCTYLVYNIFKTFFYSYFLQNIFIKVLGIHSSFLKLVFSTKVQSKFLITNILKIFIKHITFWQANWKSVPSVQNTGFRVLWPLFSAWIVMKSLSMCNLHGAIDLYQAVTILVMFPVSNSNECSIHCANMAPDYYFDQPQFGYNKSEGSKIKMATPW